MELFQPIIGLEVHVELKTRSKMFCSCRADYFGHQPNTHVCPVCLGLPGALPVPNQKAIEWCLLTGLALNCQIPLFAKFDRKNYFYPDLPKGYQISQYDQPFCREGWLMVNEHKIRLRRVHLEEDTAKLMHDELGGIKWTLIDFNRSGVPLMEIVSEPDLKSMVETKAYLKKLQQIIRFLGVSDADMEKGSMRCESNISLSLHQNGELSDYKVEIKNLNSFRFVEKALAYEIKRQEKVLSDGGKIFSHTRGWDESKKITFIQRSKETAADYRYFSEPDIPPFHWSKAIIARLKKIIPELPDDKKARFIKNYRIAASEAEILISNLRLADYFEETAMISTRFKIIPSEIAKVIINKKIDYKKLSPILLVKTMMKKKTIKKVGGAELIRTIKQVLKENTRAVADYQKGRSAALQFLIGAIMKKTKGRVEINEVKTILNKLLK